LILRQYKSLYRKYKGWLTTRLPCNICAKQNLGTCGYRQRPISTHLTTTVSLPSPLFRRRLGATCRFSSIVPPPPSRPNLSCTPSLTENERRKSDILKTAPTEPDKQNVHGDGWAGCKTVGN